MGLRERAARLSRPAAIAGVALVVAAWLPLIMVLFTSPQYPQQSPCLRIYAWKLAGQASEFKVLSHFVGFHFPPDIPELKSMTVPWLFVGLGVLALVAAGLGYRMRRWIVLTVFTVLLALSAWGQFRLYQSGHNLDPDAPMRTVIKPFTPPLFGWMRIRKIRIYHLPDFGAVLILGAAVGLLASCRRRRDERAPASAPEIAPPPKVSPEIVGGAVEVAGPRSALGPQT